MEERSGVKTEVQAPQLEVNKWKNQKRKLGRGGPGVIWAGGRRNNRKE